MLEIIKVAHNSPEWYEMRKTGIGGSDAAAVLGLNPWKTNVQLWGEKTGLKEPQEVSDNKAVEYGKKAEKHLIELFKLDYPEYTVKSPKNVVYKHDFMFASLDAELVEKATGRKGVLEIKTSNILSSMSREKWNDKIPDNYYIQVLHYLIVTGYDFAILKAQLKSTDSDGKPYLRTIHKHFERKDLLGDMKILYLAEKEFWYGNVLNKIKPAVKFRPI